MRGVSVIICARNESETLLENIPLFLAQKYPEFELVVVDDCSLDDTENVLRAFAGRHANFKAVYLKENQWYWGGKKFALTMGIKAAKHDTVLLTDADCKPRNNQWIENMMIPFEKGASIVLGYGAYQKRSGFLNQLIRFDAFHIALQYMSFALASVPYMGVGRNLAYHKELFFRNKGFASHQHIPSGDDDLFIRDVATKTNTSIQPDADGHTLSVPENNFSSWMQQKKRHITTGNHYKFRHQLLLALFFLSRFTLFLLFPALLIFNYHPEWVGGLVAFRIIVQYAVLYPCMKKLSETDLWLFSPFLELVLLAIYPIFAVSNLFTPKNKWRK